MVQQAGCFQTYLEMQNDAVLARGARCRAQLQAEAKREFFLEDPFTKLLGSLS
jgi:hypothetical protein